MKVINVEQRSPEWHALRQRSIGASDMCGLMKTVSWSNPTKLRKQKQGLAKEEATNQHIQRGIDTEPLVLQHYPEYIPLVVQHDEHPWAIASLDGYSQFDNRVLEIKAPGWQTHQEALDGKIPAKYLPQVQWQLFVTGADDLLYVSCFEGELVQVLIAPDKAYQAELLAIAQAFYDKHMRPAISGPTSECTELAPALKEAASYDVKVTLNVAQLSFYKQFAAKCGQLGWADMGTSKAVSHVVEAFAKRFDWNTLSVMMSLTKWVEPVPEPKPVKAPEKKAAKAPNWDLAARKLKHMPSFLKAHHLVELGLYKTCNQARYYCTVDGPKAVRSNSRYAWPKANVLEYINKLKGR